MGDWQQFYLFDIFFYKVIDSECAHLWLPRDSSVGASIFSAELPCVVCWCSLCQEHSCVSAVSGLKGCVLSLSANVSLNSTSYCNMNTTNLQHMTTSDWFWFWYV